MALYKVIETCNAPNPIGCYSQAVRIENFLFLSGQIGIDPQTGELVADTCELQIHQVFKNLQAVIKSGGADFSHIVKLNVYLTDLNDFAMFNRAMEQYFAAPYPARSVVQIVALPKAAAIEIDAIVFVKSA